MADADHLPGRFVDDPSRAISEAPMRSALIRVNRPEVIMELVDHLRGGGLRTVLVGSEACRVVDLGAREEQQAGIELGFFLRAWQAANPGVDISLVLEPR
jgi:hypothetical protein